MLYLDLDNRTPQETENLVSMMPGLLLVFYHCK